MSERYRSITTTFAIVGHMKKAAAFLLLITLGTQAVYAAAPALPQGFRWDAVPELTDEFEGMVLDSSKWYDYHPHWVGRAPSEFKQGNAYVADGNLNLKSTLRHDPSTVNDPNTDIWVDAAACVSKGWSAKPGYYYETRMKASNLSMTSSFWFRVGDYSEIDVIEHVGNASDPAKAWKAYEYHANTHVYGSQSGPSVGQGWTMPTRGRDEYHTYGLWWKDPTNLWFYHNDVKVMEITPSVPFEEDLKLIFDTEVFTWVGLPLPENLTDDTKNTMKVDWVRTYQMVEDISTYPSLPVVQAEDYDPAGYYDTTSTNQGGVYRPEEAVDLEVTADDGGGYNVGWITAGEWLEYTLDDIPDWLDSLALRVASINSGRTITVQLDGALLGTVTVPDTGDWQTWETVSLKNLDIPAGTGQVLRVQFNEGGVNLNWLQLYAVEPYHQWASVYPVNLGDEADDYDGDGSINFDEYVADTNPDNPADRLVIQQIQDTSILFDSSTNRNYALLRSTNLTDGAWSVAVPARAGTGGADTMDITRNAPTEYYRLEVSLPDS